jgi:hypothetical protein
MAVGLPVLENFHEIASAVARMERELAQFQAAVAKIENRAVFEIPDMLEQVLAHRPEAVVGR